MRAQLKEIEEILDDDASSGVDDAPPVAQPRSALGDAENHKLAVNRAVADKASARASKPVVKKSVQAPG